MKNNITLSYIVTTYNKISYLKQVLPYLLKNCQDDEEIIIVDGGSNDGTADYLQNLFEQGKIHQFISEKDRGEAEGFNKGILMAKGELVKIITDDDLFHYPNIQICKQYMLQNKEIDVVIGNMASLRLTHTHESTLRLVILKCYQKWFEEWLDKQTKNIFFCGLPLMIRKKSLAFLGLFDTSFKHIDLEYSIRISNKQANISFYTPLMLCTVINQDSVSTTAKSLADSEMKRVCNYYDFKIPPNYFSTPTKKQPTILKRIWNKGWRILGVKKQEIPVINHNYIHAEFDRFENISDLYLYLNEFLEKSNQENDKNIDNLFISRK